MSGCPICALDDSVCEHRLGRFTPPPTVSGDGSDTLADLLCGDFPSAQDAPRFLISGGTLVSTNEYVRRYGAEGLVV